MQIMKTEMKPMVLVFAGPNGSGKSTITSMMTPIGEYINADDIKKILRVSDLEAAQIAEKKRNLCISNHDDFTFETVLSTDRNLKLLMQAKENDFFIKSFFVLTNSPYINISRVKQRVLLGGHDVPEDKIISRYKRSLEILPELIKVSDICNVYDNTEEPMRIFSRKKESYRAWENEYWDIQSIKKLTGVATFNAVFYKDYIADPYYIDNINEASYKILKEAGFTLGYNNGVVTINKNDKAEVMKLLGDMQNTKIPKIKK